MSGAIDRTIDELAVRYDLHPELCDIFVEGESDRSLLKWFVKANGRPTVQVYPISTVALPAEALFARDLPDKNRSRVIALAVLLEEKVRKKMRLTCVADADCDHFLGRTHGASHLLLTDYTSMEMYAFDADTVHKVCRLVNCESKTGAEVLKAIEPLLKLLFCIRLANIVMGLGLRWLSFSRCCSIDGHQIEFDSDAFVSRYLNTKSGMRDKKDVFMAFVSKCQGEVRNDVRLCIRGHDFTDVLAWYVSKLRKNHPAMEPETLRQLLFASVTITSLAKHTLFQELLARTETC